MVKTNRTKKRITKFILYILLIMVSLLAILPFIWMVSSSFKTNSEIFTFPPVWIPRDPTVEGYSHLFNTPMYGNTLFIDFGRNSLFVSLTTAIVTVAMAALGAYGMSRFKFKGSSPLKYLILLSQMLPGALLLIPLYMIMNKFERVFIKPQNWIH